jgi:hypothetical protein
MDTQDRDDLLASMYDTDTPTKQREQPPADANGMRRSRRLAIGAISYEIPTVEHLAMLERRLGQQAQQIADQGHYLKRLEAMLALLRTAVRRQGGVVSDIGHTLDRGYDRFDTA